MNLHLQGYVYLWMCEEAYKLSGLLLLNQFNFNPCMDKYHIHYNMGIKLHIHSQTSTVQPLKFGNG